MKKNRIAISILLFLFTIPVVGIILINNLSSNFFKNAISNYVAKNTEYLASIDGDFNLNLLSRLTISVENLTIRSKEENPNKENLRVKSINFSIPILNLINSSYMPEYFKINEVNASIKITDKTVEKNTPLAELFTKIGLQESLVTLTQVEHQQTGDSISLIIKDLKASPFGLRVNSVAEIDNYKSKTPSLSGNVKIDASNILPILKLASDIYNINLDIDSTALNQKDRQLKISTTFSTDENNTVNFDDINLSMLGVSLRGKLKAQNISFKKTKFNLTSSFEINKVNLTRLQKFTRADFSMPFKFGQLKTSVSGSETNLNLDSTINFFKKNIQQNPTIIIKNKISEFNLSKGTFTIDQLSASGLDSNINVEGVLGFNKEMSADIKYSANIKSLKKWIELFGLEHALEIKESTFKDVKITGLAKLNDDQINLSQTSLNFDDVKANIEFNSVFRKKNKFDFVMSVNQIDLDRYINSENPKPITPETAAVGIVQLPIELLSSLEGKGEIKIDKILTSGITIEDIVIGLLANNAVITIKPAEAKILDGTYTSSLIIDSRESIPKINVNSKLKDIDLSRIDKTIDVIGRLNFEGQLEALGSDSGKLLQSAKGQALVELNSGALRYFNATGLIDTVQTIVKCRCLQPLPKQGVTVFETASASLTLNPKLDTTLDLNVQGANFLIKGDGYIDGMKDFSRYKLTLSMIDSEGSATRKSVTIPINCKGSISKPKCRPNVQPLVKSVIKNQTTDKIKGILSDKIKESIGKEAGESLKKIFNF
ncbi:MAG: hypothetical protein CBC29_00175 [Methylococcaceae bacterium TMED69]|nr:MAG: hypothetical protein CBC29_00175 [Methylococcaceae bacterium TMED69]